MHHAPAGEGRQYERTALAWLRTAFALAGGCALLLRNVSLGTPVGRALTLVLLACGAVAVGCAHLRYRVVHRGHRRGGSEAAPPALLAAGIAGAMTAAGLAALALLLLSD